MAEYNPSPEGNPSLLARRNRLQTEVVKFIGRHTPKCNEVVRILSQGMDKKLSLKTRLQLKLHYLICAWCQRYAEQLKVLRKVAKAFPEHACDGHTKLPDGAKERLKRTLKGS